MSKRIVHSFLFPLCLLFFSFSCDISREGDPIQFRLNFTDPEVTDFEQLSNFLDEVSEEHNIHCLEGDSVEFSMTANNQTITPTVRCGQNIILRLQQALIETLSGRIMEITNGWNCPISNPPDNYCVLDFTPSFEFNANIEMIYNSQCTETYTFSDNGTVLVENQSGCIGRFRSSYPRLFTYRVRSNNLELTPGETTEFDPAAPGRERWSIR